MSELASSGEELTLPKATVQKIVSEILSSEFTVTKDAREAIIDCCIEFIMILATESNDIAEKELKKTISSDHVLKAMKDLGFVDYLEPINNILREVKETSKTREKKGSKFLNSGLTEEELLQKQEELFRLSRSRLQQNQKDSATPESEEIKAE